MKVKELTKKYQKKLKKKKKKKNEVFVPFVKDDEWISIKREKKYRIVFNDKIVKTIRTKFIKNINQQKNSKLAAFDRENSKLKKGEKNPNKFMTKKEYNKNIKEKRDIIVEYYDNKIKEINSMKISDFILKFLSKEKKESINSLMNTNLNSKFYLDKA